MKTRNLPYWIPALNVLLEGRFVTALSVFELKFVILFKPADYMCMERFSFTAYFWSLLFIFVFPSR